MGNDYGKEGGGHLMVATMAMGMGMVQRTQPKNQNSRGYVLNLGLSLKLMKRILTNYETVYSSNG
jgi:hypothetical protein